MLAYKFVLLVTVNDYPEVQGTAGEGRFLILFIKNVIWQSKRTDFEATYLVHSLESVSLSHLSHYVLFHWNVLVVVVVQLEG
jgi:hypothetical protein